MRRETQGLQRVLLTVSALTLVAAGTANTNGRAYLPAFIAFMGRFQT